jgi:hypothetical protein
MLKGKNVQNLKIIPYVAIDGIMTFTDTSILSLYDRMVKDGTHEIVFYAGHITGRESFLKYMKRPSVMLFVLIRNKDHIGFTWLDGIEDRAAYNHFCLFSEYWGDTVEIGTYALNLLMNMQGRDGYVFDLFKGTVPVWNTHAVDFAVKCGGQTLGVLPNAVWNAAKNKSEDAVFIYYTRREK